jgi:hypothetical protein
MEKSYSAQHASTEGLPAAEFTVNEGSLLDDNNDLQQQVNDIEAQIAAGIQGGTVRKKS